MPSKKKSIEDKYVKLTQREHILKRPDSYVGSNKLQEDELYIFDSESKKMIKKKN